jgi:hypothetical protein
LETEWPKTLQDATSLKKAHSAIFMAGAQFALAGTKDTEKNKQPVIVYLIVI